MQIKTKTPEDYVAALPADRQEVIAKIRKTINKNLPKGFEESSGYGMLCWSVPHSIFPPGYHCDPTKPLMLIGLASQKNYIALYHMGMYAGSLVDWFRAEWPKHTSQKLDMGKSCIRMKKIDDVPIALIGELAKKLTPQQWVEQYQSALERR